MPTLYELPNLQPADDSSADIQLRLQAAEDVLHLLSAQAGEVDEYVLFEDRGGYLDSDMAVHAFHVHYDHQAGTVRLTTAARPTIALGAAWLVEHGADAEELVHEGEQSAPANARSAAIARRIVTARDRYAVVDHGVELSETWALLRDADPRAADRPYLLQIQTVRDEGGYTLREGSFNSPQEAQAWLETRDRPLPPALATDTEMVSAAAGAARARSATAPEARVAGPKSAAAWVTPVAATGGPRR